MSRDPVLWRVASVAIALLAAFTSLPTLADEPDARSARERQVARAAAFLRDCCGLPSDSLPDILVADQMSGLMGGRYVKPGETVGTIHFDRPTILLRSHAFDSDVLMEAVITHEAFHFKIDRGMVPDDL
jgi:hypothetical protein